jgi:hypothetical protein
VRKGANRERERERGREQQSGDPWQNESVFSCALFLLFISSRQFFQLLAPAPPVQIKDEKIADISTNSL